MEIEKPHTQLEVRYFVIAQHEFGLKQVQIVDKVFENFGISITQSAVSKIISKYKEDGTVEDRPKSGRPKKLTETQEGMIIEAVLENRTLNATRVFQDNSLNPQGKSHVSARTISRTLKSRGLIDSTDLVEHINEDCMEERLAFAAFCQQTNFNWERVIFTDECDLFPDKQGKLHYRRFKGERVDLDLGPMERWDVRKVKVWGSISYNGVGTLVRYQGTVKKELYIEFLQEILLKDFPLLKGTKTRQGKFILQQDNASPHVALDTKKFIEGNRISTLKWPSNSPDLSIIENVWSFVKEELFKKNDSLETADDTWEEIQKIWHGQVNLLLPKLYSSLPNRMKTVIELEGKRIN